jgi:ABC-2 type transport system permease protein
MITIPQQYVGFLTVLKREVTRFWSIRRQTLLAPLLETFLYITIFGAALGSRIQQLNGVPYITFVIPGLIMMSFAMNAYSNNSSTLIQQKLQRSIDDQLASPVSNAQLMLAYTFGGFLRGLLVSGLAFITANLLLDLPMHNPFIFFGGLIVTALFFALLGVLVGVNAEKFDTISFYQTFVIQPLIFLGGVFYSVNLLPPLAQTASHFNPIFYMINTIRYGMTGVSDVHWWIGMLIAAVGASILFAINTWIFTRSTKLRV